MIPANDRIIVRVNMAQKSHMMIGGVVFQTAMKYEVNYRERSPVVAEVVNGNSVVKDGDVILSHHNHFYGKSPYFLMDDLFSIPFAKTIFAVLRPDGTLKPVCGNILGVRVDVETSIPVAVEYRKKHTNRIRVTLGGSTKYRDGDLIFTRPYAPYDIVYIVDKVERRITKVSEDMVVGVEKKYYAK
jgi:hypothetical protein